MNLNEKDLKEKVKPGTAGGKMFYTAVFFAAGILFVLLGFWKTIFVVAMAALGWFFGSSQDLRTSVSGVVNKVLPPKNQKVEYTEEELAKVRKMKKEEADKAEKAGE